MSQQLVDPERIYAAGCSAGAVQAGMMAFLRSEYLAAAMLNSGGLVESYALSEPSHVPAVITAHGATSTDVVVVSSRRRPLRGACRAGQRAVAVLEGAPIRRATKPVRRRTTHELSLLL